MLAALRLEVPEWAHARLLRPALQPVLVGTQSLLITASSRVGYMSNFYSDADGQGAARAGRLAGQATVAARAAAGIQRRTSPARAADLRRRRLHRPRRGRAPADQARAPGRAASSFKLFPMRGPADVLTVAREVQFC